jgi:hypothetical protein
MLGHDRDKSDEALVAVRCKDAAGNEFDGRDSLPYGACIIQGPFDEKNGNYTFVLTPLRAGNLTLVVTIGAETVPQASHMTFEVSKPICPPQVTVLSEAEADIRNPCVCAIGTKRLVTGNTGSPQCELCPADTFTFAQGVFACEDCPKEARCFGGAEVLNAAGFWLDLQCVANGINQLSISRTTVFGRDHCPLMKCPGGETACSKPNSTSPFAQELNKLYLRLPSVAATNRSRAASCPPDKCPAEAPWLSTVTLNCYPEQAKSYYLYCALSGSLGTSESTWILPQLTSLQCNEGYQGRLCASCSKGYGVQVQTRALRFAPIAWMRMRFQSVDPKVCRETLVRSAPIWSRTGC